MIDGIKMSKGETVKTLRALLLIQINDAISVGIYMYKW